MFDCLAHCRFRPQPSGWGSVQPGNLGVEQATPDIGDKRQVVPVREACQLPITGFLAEPDDLVVGGMDFENQRGFGSDRILIVA